MDKILVIEDDLAVQRALRRTFESAGFDDVEVNFSKMELHRDGHVVALTPQEFKMLRFFLNHQERVVSRTELLNEVWGYTNYPTTRTVDTHILRLRQKLEKDPADPVHFRTVHGTGYKFVRQATRLNSSHLVISYAVF